VQVEGVIEAKNRLPVYAPREARLETVSVEPGDEVRAGDPLAELVDPDLSLQLQQLEADLLFAREDVQRAEHALREFDLTDGGLDYMGAERSLTLHTEEDRVLGKIVDIHKSLSEMGLVGELELLELELRRISARRGLLEDRMWLQLAEQGQVDLLRERKAQDLENAQVRLDLLETKRETLKSELARLDIRAPMDAQVTDVIHREGGGWLEAGDPILRLAVPEDGYRVRVRVQDRNVDLIRKGMPVRMESRVYTSSLEGYTYGTVERVVTDPLSRDPDGFEVWVELTEWPVEPVLGSRLDVEILLEKQGVLQWMFRQSSRKEGSRRSKNVEKQAAGEQNGS
jgi:multidrug resistance efflux pump